MDEQNIPCLCGRNFGLLNCGRLLIGSHYCFECKIRICGLCKDACIKHGTQCDNCHCFADEKKMGNCDYCNLKLCRKCQIDRFDINLRDHNVCKFHKIPCYDKLRCDSIMYKADFLRCQIDNCPLFACEENILFMEKLKRRGKNGMIKYGSVDYVCHKHMFNCSGCRKQFPMVSQGYVKMKYEKDFIYCYQCFDKIKSFISSLIGNRTYDRCQMNILFQFIVPWINVMLYYDN